MRKFHLEGKKLCIQEILRIDIHVAGPHFGGYVWLLLSLNNEVRIGVIDHRSSKTMTKVKSAQNLQDLE